MKALPDDSCDAVHRAATDRPLRRTPPSASRFVGDPVERRFAATVRRRSIRDVLQEENTHATGQTGHECLSLGEHASTAELINRSRRESLTRGRTA